MESGQSSNSNNDPMKLMSLDFCGENENLAVNDVPPLDHPDLRDQNTHQIMNLMESGKTNWTTQAEPLNMPWWAQHQEASSHQNYAKFLLESSSSFVPIPTPSSDHRRKLEGFPWPAYGVSHNVSDANSDMSYNHCLGMACGSTSSEVDAWELRLLMQHNEAVGNCFINTSDNQLQNLSSWRQNPILDSSCTNTVPQAGTPFARVAPVGRSQSPAESSVSKAKTTMKDRNRKIRIHEKLNALQQLLPQSGEGFQACVLDDVIDHVKFLQLKIKDLCKTRLEGELPAVPIIFHEGYGHYLSDTDQQISNEPLEEMVGKLLEQNPARAMQLLEMKGLLLLPIEFAQGLVSDPA